MKNEPIAKTYSWVEVLSIRNYLLECVTDAGTSESYDSNREFLDSDDLRVALKVSGGCKVLLPPDSRIVIDGVGDVHIEVLMSR